MTSIKGQKYQLAGFDMTQHGSLVQVFAKFCGADQDPANLPETRTVKMFANSPAQELPVIYPSLSAQDIVEALVGPDDTTPPNLRGIYACRMTRMICWLIWAPINSRACWLRWAKPKNHG